MVSSKAEGMGEKGKACLSHACHGWANQRCFICLFYVHEYFVCSWCPRSSEEDIRSPGTGDTDSCVRWEVFLYMCCSCWLMNKAALAYSRAEYSQAGRDKEKESRQS